MKKNQPRNSHGRFIPTKPKYHFGQTVYFIHKINEDISIRKGRIIGVFQDVYKTDLAFRYSILYDCYGSGTASVEQKNIFLSLNKPAQIIRKKINEDYLYSLESLNNNVEIIKNLK